MNLTRLDCDTPFPPAELALREPDGLLAIGGELSIRRLRAAYAGGIFPWYSDGQPILWWSPDPRMILCPDEFHATRSLRKTLRRIEDASLPIQVRMNTACAQVIAACAAPRRTQDGTWIVRDIQDAYLAWHEAGQVHSVETWMDDELVGGLYGVGMGRMFFGESMFTRVSDASKIALAYLAAFLRRHHVRLMDCQQETPHLASLGGRIMPRHDFLRHIRIATRQGELPWARGRLLPDGAIQPC